MIQDILQAAQQIEKNPDISLRFDFQPYRGINSRPDQELNHFLIFLKPEALNYFPNAKTKNLLHLILSTLWEWNIDIGGISLLSGAYLRKNNIIDKNYKILSNISRHGINACSSAAQNLLYELSKCSNLNMNVIGGHELLEINRELSPYTLCSLAHNLETKKLGSGAYYIQAHIFGQDYLILNPFYPYQIENLTRCGTGIIALECFSRKSMNDLRFNMVGNIVPEQASLNSIRRKIFESRKVLNLSQVNIQYNYLHISPSPLEAIYQLMHFFGKPETDNYVEYDSINMGALLAKIARFNRSSVLAMEDNLEVNISGVVSPILDCTENLSTHETLELFLKIIIESNH